MALALALTLTAPSSRAAYCAAVGEVPAGRTRDQVMAAAKNDVTAGRLGTARAGYLWVLARAPEDAEALYGLARVDAWEGCFALAESSYAKILSRHPDDADALAGYVDLLLWQGRHDEAERLLARGLARSPDSAPLLLRQGRLAGWRGDAPRARALLAAAAKNTPNDPDVLDASARAFTDEVRVIGRLDRYPTGYPDVASVSAQMLRRFERFELYGGAQVIGRTQTSLSVGATDVRIPVGFYYYPGIGAALGLEVTPAVPAVAVPNVAVRGSVLLPVVQRVGAYLAYSFWHFDGGATVHIVNPSLGIALVRDVRLDLRGWISSLQVPGAAPGEDSGLSGAVGAGLAVPLGPKLEVDGWYTYGVQLDRNPALLQILLIESHAVGTYADVRLGPKIGLRPLVGLEHRSLPSGASLIGLNLELGAYWRW